MDKFKRTRNIVEYITEILSNNDKYVSNGKLNRSLVIDDIQSYEEELLEILLSDDLIRSRFVIDVSGTVIFKTEALIKILELKSYISDNYTQFSNKIGLYAEGKSLLKTSNVILHWPYKDALLTGGMIKDEVESIGKGYLIEDGKDEKEANRIGKQIDSIYKDTSKDEIMLNEVVSSDDISSLKEPKAFSRITKYSTDYIEGKSVESFSENDNLILKGNNLIALHSLKKRYFKSIRGIFIDPPYYFNKIKPKDSFQYNSNFKLSTWLTFMKNRLEVAKDLLADDGIIAVVIGIDGYAHLKILMDELFEVNVDSRRYIGTITWRKTDNQSNIGDFANVIDYILLYRKNSNTKLNKLPLTEKAQKEYSYTDEKTGEKYRRSNILDLTRGRHTYEVTTPNGDKLYGPWMIEESEYKKLYDNDDIHWPKTGKQIPYGKTYLKNKLESGQITTDFWDASYGTNQRSSSEIKALFGSGAFEFAKPEKLAENIISLISSKNDIILDFFMGTATTQATAMKMGRRFIGVEQMDYIETLSKKRLQKVIAGELGGISEDVGWNEEEAKKQNASFIYAELMEENQIYVNKINQAQDIDEVWTVFEEMRDIADFRFQVKLDQLTPNSVPRDITLVQLKTIMISALKSSSLYVSAHETDDPDLNITDEERLFNKSFYKEE